ncbi:hypothetical protein [Bacteroides sp. 51]|uniref:hypothetical protein n=1 Tax=Bacteroides sp. 51 TaxID=2302938 RepID=UPI0013D00B4A|nr:hypothetical protein [Bacteroides sp. 51]NDV84802.1 hypothetical protein [Bacteroides sp. 51]
MNLVEIIITGIVAIGVAGGAIFAYSRKRSNKSNIKNVTITGNGKIIGGDDNSIQGNNNSVNKRD